MLNNKVSDRVKGENDSQMEGGAKHSVGVAIARGGAKHFMGMISCACMCAGLLSKLHNHGMPVKGKVFEASVRSR